MRIQVSLSIGRHRVLFGGVAALLVLAGIFALCHLLAGTMSPQEAESGIREYLRWRLGQQHLAELDREGRKVPDLAMALRWKEESEKLKTLRFIEVSVRRSLLVPPLRRRTNFYVRTVIRDGDNQEQTRYFRFNGVNLGVLSITEKGVSGF